MENESGSKPPGSHGLAENSTASLIRRLKEGDGNARDILLCRYLVPLRRWAHGRLPFQARDLLDTDDLVQNALLRTLNHPESLDFQKDGALMAYLRRILLNQIHDQIRRSGRQPGQATIEERVPDAAPSPLQAAIGEEMLRRYDTAMARLPEALQEAVMLRIEMGLSYEEITRALGYPSSNAARMSVSRALVWLAGAMKGDDDLSG